MLLTSRFPEGQRHQLVRDATVTEALRDRRVHQTYRIKLKGESMRQAPAPQDRGPGARADPETGA